MKVYIAFLDVLFCILMVILVMVHPKTDPKDLLKPPGNLFVYTTWSNSVYNQDVDTWMLGPDMKKPIGYDHKESDICDLVKDDLGLHNSGIGVNYENIFCRNTPDGEYIINVYSYGVTAYPMTVNVQVAMNGVNGVDILFEEKITLTHPKEEVTVIRFRLKDGKVVPGSVHHTFESLFDMR